jgi:hypothetical protein
MREEPALYASQRRTGQSLTDLGRRRRALASLITEGGTSRILGPVRPASIHHTQIDAGSHGGVVSTAVQSQWTRKSRASGEASVSWRRSPVAALVCWRSRCPCRWRGRPAPCRARLPDAEHLYSATGLAPALYESATLHRRGRISRQGLAEHRDALMGIAWGLSLSSPSFVQRNTELRARGMAPIPARVALARNACRLAYRILATQQPFDEEAYRRGRLSRGR